ncbi:MAG: transposase [Endozoicomonadaceae bacterium]|nr:transposase [Endozoicomonadaceae bacterium]
MFWALLLGAWYRLSDMPLSQCLCRELLFREFFNLELGGEVSEASTWGGFQHDWSSTICGLRDNLLVEINR